MLFSYALCFIPLAIGLVLWLSNKEIHFLEFIGSLPIALLTVGVIHFITYQSLTSDNMVNSGELIRATYYPEWIEEYQQPHQMCTNTGKTTSCTTYYTTEHRTHSRYWESYSNINTSHNVTKKEFDNMVAKFGNINTKNGNKSGFDGGDPNIYSTYKKVIVKTEDDIYYPVTKVVGWTNKIKATKSTFKFIDIPKSVKTYEYPLPKNSFSSNRLLGEAKKDFKLNEIDKLNSLIGFHKHGNIIVIGYSNNDSMQARYQESAWIGGKENDLVLCYGKDSTGKVVWSYVFGWSDNQEVKRNLETILLSGNFKVSEIRDEILKNYKCKDFKDFNYMSIEPPTYTYIIIILVLAITQGIYYFLMGINDLKQDE
jgi:hypothetical protein